MADLCAAGAVRELFLDNLKADGETAQQLLVLLAREVRTAPQIPLCMPCKQLFVAPVMLRFLRTHLEGEVLWNVQLTLLRQSSDRIKQTQIVT